VKILLFGGSGQLGFELMRRAHDLNFQIIAPVSSEVNVAEREQVLFLARQLRPDLILNCAAYTAVDKAEEDREAAFRVNAQGAEAVALAALECGAFLIHVSTDYVFDGTATTPRKENDAVAPLNVYGASKLKGELRIQAILPKNSLIVRTSSLHGQKGVNFVNTMVQLFKKRDQVEIVMDQVMSPTWAGWLAEVLLDFCKLRPTGVVHATCAGAVSWYDFAAKVYELSRERLPHAVTLKPITTAQFGRPARRPPYSVLDCQRLSMLLGRSPIPWEQGLRNHLKEIDAFGGGE
jgi:dTDP-4-dehydrorhamnose reductase